MASTSVHLPDALVERLDALAEQLGMSRNRVILKACEDLLNEARGEWPQGFFRADDLSAEDLAELRDAALEAETAIYQARRDRQVPPL